MKKILGAVAIALAGFMFASCGSTQTASGQVTDAKVIGAEGIERPAWVVLGKEAEDGLYAKGYGKMSTLETSLKSAKADGRNELARTLQVSVKNALTTYTRDTGIKEDVLKLMEEASIQKSEAMLKGSKQVDYWMDKDEGVYVLMFVPYQAVVPEVNSIVKDYTQSQKSAFTVETAKNYIKENLE